MSLCLGSFWKKKVVVVGVGVIGLLWSSAVQAELPYLILRQSAEVQQAWRDVDALVRENVRLQPPLPDPYWARGDLWTLAGNHEEALEDYLRATRILIAGNPSPAEKSRTLQRLSNSLDRLVRQPRPSYPIQAATAYEFGLQHYHRARFDEALEYFTEATRLLPSDAIYRAYRGLTYRQLGMTDEAEQQVVIATSILRQPRPFRDVRQEFQEFYRRLERVQGPLRQWLQETMHRPPARKDAAEVEARHELHRL